MFTDSGLVPQIGNNSVSARRSSRVEGQSLGWSETFAIPFKKDNPPTSKNMPPSILTKGMVFSTDFSGVCNGPISF